MVKLVEVAKETLYNFVIYVSGKHASFVEIVIAYLG